MGSHAVSNCISWFAVHGTIVHTKQSMGWWSIGSRRMLSWVLLLEGCLLSLGAAAAPPHGALELLSPCHSPVCSHTLGLMTGILTLLLFSTLGTGRACFSNEAVPSSNVCLGDADWWMHLADQGVTKTQSQTSLINDLLFSFTLVEAKGFH